ncbi:MAG TPA: methyltransferase domain-containing protein [Dehalococcoidia bacterium]
MPDLLSAALFERDGTVLTAHRQPERRPFGAQWVLPMTLVGEREAAEEALRRHVREQFGIDVTGEQFVDTVYLEDPNDAQRYVANVFRAEMSAGPMRFRADGDYDDARWLAPADVAQVWMPPALRDLVVRILSGDIPPPAETAWDIGDHEQAIPLAERERRAATETVPPPDNRAFWTAVAASYQREHAAYDPSRLRWSRGLYEDCLHVLDDVSGKRGIILGSGTGHDVVALASMGARAVGVDIVPEQVECGRRLAADRGVENASFAVADLVDLSRFDDASFDLAVSIHALDFVEDADRALREAARVLRHGGVLALAVLHPWNQMFTPDPPYRTMRPYWSPFVDENWDEAALGDAGRFRSYRRTVEQWCRILDDAGFALERLLEPYQGEIDDAEQDGFDMERARLMPQILIMKARKR